MTARGWMEVRDRAWLEIKGPDAVRFLNGQVTNNVAADLSGKVLPACLCDIKGKVQALVWITAGPSPDSLIIEVEATQKEAILARLDRYLIADQCALSEWEPPGPVFHVIGAAEPPAGARECWRLGVKGFDLPPASFSPGKTDLPELGADDVAWLSLIHGIPESGKEITGEAFPSELHLDRWAVDFHKGCYLGQEVISRIESVGSTKKYLALYSTPFEHRQGEVFFDEKGKEELRVTRNSAADREETGRFLTLVFGKGAAREGWRRRDLRRVPD